MELRWVLLGLGLLVLLGIYLTGRGLLRLPAQPSVNLTRKEPKLNDSDATDDSSDTELLLTDPVLVKPKRNETTVIERKPSPRKIPEKVVAVRLVPTGENLSGDTAVLTLRKYGLEHGTFGIFHKIVNGDTHNPAFSVASLTEPGSFDLTNLSESKIAGLSLFLALPGVGDPVERFDDMIATARHLGRELDSELFDEKGSSWSVQRERFIREELIEYRHHLEHG